MDILAQCGTTTGRGKDGIKGTEGEVGFTGLIMIVTMEQAMVEGVAEGKGHPIPGDVGVTARAVSVVTS